MLIELTNISKYYKNGERTIQALDNISLKIEKNEFTAIMGKSGCGKTTLLNVMATILAPDSGIYRLDGKDIGTFSEKQLAICKRKTISVIFQNYNLVEELNVANNIILPYVFDQRKYDSERLMDITDKLQISDLMNKYPAQMSGGEKQRVAIARALLLHPKVILADEPTGNLDEENAKTVIDLLRFCVDNYNQTIVMVTHDADMAANADRIIHMRNGRIIDA